MIQSVWLSNLIVSSFNDESSLLVNYYRCITRLVKSENCIMRLSEPENGVDTFFYLSKKGAYLIDSKAVKISEETSRQVIKTKTLKFENGKLYCPLYLENTATFGILIFDVAEKITDTEKIKETLLAFSVILYSECMGSIVKSFHTTAMSVKGVCVDYSHGKIVNRVVNNVSLDIYNEEFTVIMGASGSGKTSLLNVLGGMLTASKGSVTWKNLCVTDMTEKEQTAYRRDIVGFIFQRYNLIEDLTVEENIEIVSSLVKNPLPTEEVLEMVGLKDKAKFYPSELSGGEQQRVCIARALVKRAELLLCDEPTGALDTENAKQIISILKNISKQQKIPVVVITHNPNLVVIADHCITISNGTVSKDVLQPFALSCEDIEL